MLHCDEIIQWISELEYRAQLRPVHVRLRSPVHVHNQFLLNQSASVISCIDNQSRTTFQCHMNYYKRYDRLKQLSYTLSLCLFLHKLRLSTSDPSFSRSGSFHSSLIPSVSAFHFWLHQWDVWQGFILKSSAAACWPDAAYDPYKFQQFKQNIAQSNGKRCQTCLIDFITRFTITEPSLTITHCKISKKRFMFEQILYKCYHDALQRTGNSAFNIYALW